MPVIETRGSLSSRGYGQLTQTVPAVPAVYIEDVFSTWLYGGTGATQTITNNVNLSVAAGRGGLVWLKGRSTGANNALYDTVRGATSQLSSNLGDPQTTQSTGLTAFTSSGFTLGNFADINTNGAIYASWTFAEQQKFFDIVSYSGNDNPGRTISHNLGSVPGVMIVKSTNSPEEWAVYHRSVGAGSYLLLNRQDPAASATDVWNGASPTASVFTVGSSGLTNKQGSNYVAYLFAHDAGGFGASGTDNVISCGSYTGNSSTTGPIVTLGWEPQWLLIKRTTTTSANWSLIDNMRGFLVGSTDRVSVPNAASSESSITAVTPTSTGFQLNTTDATYNASGSTYIYIAIRRGPMRTPTLGTDVFTPTVYTGTNVNNRLVNTTIAPDMVWMRQRNDTVLAGMVVGDRMRGQPYWLTGSNAVEVTSATAFDQQIVSALEYGNAFTSMNGVWVGTDTTAKLNVNTTSNNHIAEAFRRAPGFFDIVCYTGTGAARTINHNLGVVPELMIIKSRSAANEGTVYTAPTGATSYFSLNSNASVVTGNTTRWNSTAPTASVFSLGTSSAVNASNGTFVNYLFASCPGVSKVGSYTGTASAQTIDCGFSTAARFILIKSTVTGDWYVWDSARGINSGTDDPYLLLNSTAAEVTNNSSVYPESVGFGLMPSGVVNASGQTFIFLAIA